MRARTWSCNLDMRCPRCGSRLFLPGRLLAHPSEDTIERMYAAWEAAGWPAFIGGSEPHWSIIPDKWTVLQDLPAVGPRGRFTCALRPAGDVSGGDRMNDDESMALALRYAREFFKSDAPYLPEVTLRYCAYALRALALAVMSSRLRVQPDGGDAQARAVTA